MKRENHIVLILLAVIIIAIGCGSYYLYFMPVNYIGVDINPSVQFAVNRLDRVIEVTPLNEDADILISDLALKNMTIEDATAAIIDSATEVGYIDELSSDNTVVISVATENENIATKLEEKISNKIEKHLANGKIPALVLLEKNNEERKMLADEYGISYGKMLLVQKAVALNPALIEAKLVDASINDIAKSIKAARVEIKQTKKQALIQRKTQIRTIYRETYNNAVREMLNADPRIDDTLSTEEKARIRAEIIEKRKKGAKEIIKKVKEELNNNWSQVDSGDTNIPAKIKEKINDAKGRWSTPSKGTK